MRYAIAMLVATIGMVAAPSGYSQSVGGYDEKLYAKVEAILAIKAAGALSASLGALAYKINENGQRMFAKVHGDVLQIDMIMEREDANALTERSIQSMTCADPVIRLVLDAGALIHYSAYTAGGHSLAQWGIKQKDCT